MQGLVYLSQYLTVSCCVRLHVDIVAATAVEDSLSPAPEVTLRHRQWVVLLTGPEGVWQILNLKDPKHKSADTYKILTWTNSTVKTHYESVKKSTRLRHLSGFYSHESVRARGHSEALVLHLGRLPPVVQVQLSVQNEEILTDRQ